MMSKVSELLAKHGVENAEVKAELEQLLATVESDKTNGIPESRFKEVIKERNEARARIVEMESELEQSQSKLEKLETDYSEAGKWKQELDAFKEKQFNESRTLWIEKSKLFKVEETDKMFSKIDKIKADFVIKENPEDYTNEEIAQNINALKPYEKIGYFAVDNKDPGFDDSRSKKEKPTDPKNDPVFGVLYK